MMSYTASATCSRSVSSPCYTEHGQCCGAVLSGRITIIVMSRSGQLSLRCTVELNCSDLSARLAGASVTRDRAFDISEPSYVPGAARSFFIFVVHSPLGAVCMWQHRSSPLKEVRPGPHGSAGAHLSMEVRSEAEEHVAAPELSSWGGRTRSHGTRDSAEAYLDSEVKPRAEEHVAAPELNSVRRRGPGSQAT
jgi:hypothetical protein